MKMKKIFFPCLALILFFENCSSQSTAQSATHKQSTASDTTKGLKDYYAPFFPIGVAVSLPNLTGADAQLIVQQFNTLTSKNAMKRAPIHPKENRYNGAPADSIVNFAQRHGMKLRGHA